MRHSAGPCPPSSAGTARHHHSGNKISSQHFAPRVISGYFSRIDFRSWGRSTAEVSPLHRLLVGRARGRWWHHGGRSRHPERTGHGRALRTIRDPADPPGRGATVESGAAKRPRQEGARPTDSLLTELRHRIRTSWGAHTAQHRPRCRSSVAECGRSGLRAGGSASNAAFSKGNRTHGAGTRAVLQAKQSFQRDTVALQVL